MANAGKSKPLKVNDKSRAAKASAVPVVKAEVAAHPGEKKVSQRLIETIEKRKTAAAAKGGMFAGKPPGRRGRRPKNMVDYTPEHTEEDGLQVEADYDGIEYDTGIRINKHKDESFSLDRFDNSDEELNFDS